jgi:hypothetical protein
MAPYVTLLYDPSGIDRREIDPFCVCELPGALRGSNRVVLGLSVLGQLGGLLFFPLDDHTQQRSHSDTVALGHGEPPYPTANWRFDV